MSESKSSSKAFVDTTVLADSLLKVSDRRTAARDALKRFDETSLPVYAIKEFIGGPLFNFVYAHKVFMNVPTYSDAMSRIQRLSRTPQRYKTASALEAIAVAEESIADCTAQEYVDKYGANASIQQTRLDEMRLSLKTIILIAWKKRREMTTDVSNPLSCYFETAPIETKQGLLELPTRKCNPPNECCMADQLRSRAKDVEKLFDVVSQLDQDRENSSRRKALRHFKRTPKRPMTEDLCKGLGDAVFALYCPSDFKILTTNLRDHEILANVFGTDVESP